MNKLRAFCRGAVNFSRVGWIIILAALDFVFRIRLQGKSSSYSARASWLHRWSRRVLVNLNIRVERHGVPPAAGLLACNHLSYLDVMVLAAGHPIVLVAKSEIKHWPVFGLLACCAGTLFVRRDRRSDVTRFSDVFSAVVNKGVVLGLFPEGTSTDGREVLPFYSSLFEPAVAGHWPVSAAWIGYRLQNGSAENDVCYWGDATFLPHLLRLLTRENIEATVAYGPVLPPGLDRKQMALELRRQVCELAGQFRTSARTRDPDPLPLCK